MKRITIEIPDGFDDVLSITAVGSEDGSINVKTSIVELEDHNGDTLVLRCGGDHCWVKGYYANSKYCDDDDGFYE